MPLSPEAIKIREYREKLRRREKNQTPEDMEEMRREREDCERYFSENPDMFKGPPEK